MRRCVICILCLKYVPAAVCVVMLTWAPILVASQKAHSCSFDNDNNNNNNNAFQLVMS